MPYNAEFWILIDNYWLCNARFGKLIDNYWLYNARFGKLINEYLLFISDNILLKSRFSINKAIDELRSEGKLSEISTKYFGADITTE